MQKQFSANIIKQLSEDIKAKKELSGLMDSFVEDEIKRYLLQNPKINLEKIKERRQAIKGVRSVLRKSAGVFIRPTKTTGFDSLLLKHESTKERAQIYPEIYQRIFHITGSPKAILDLGCGINPLSYKFLKIKPKYYAFDVNAIVVDIVKDFFKKKKISGTAGLVNLREKSGLKLPKADICFLFKVLDSIEIEKGHKLAENLIKQIPCRWIVASFSTRTLSGRRMNHPYRGWIEQLCRRLGYFYEIMEYESEIFYLIRK